MVIHVVGDVSSSVNHLSVSFCFNLFRPECCFSDLFIPLLYLNHHSFDIFVCFVSRFKAKKALSTCATYNPVGPVSVNDRKRLRIFNPPSFQ